MKEILKKDYERNAEKIKKCQKYMSTLARKLLSYE